MQATYASARADPVAGLRNGYDEIRQAEGFAPPPLRVRMQLSVVKRMPSLVLDQ